MKEIPRIPWKFCFINCVIEAKNCNVVLIIHSWIYNKESYCFTEKCQFYEKLQLFCFWWIWISRFLIGHWLAGYPIDASKDTNQTFLQVDCRRTPNFSFLPPALYMGTDRPPKWLMIESQKSIESESMMTDTVIKK